VVVGAGATGQAEWLVQVLVVLQDRRKQGNRF